MQNLMAEIENFMSNRGLTHSDSIEALIEALIEETDLIYKDREITQNHIKIGESIRNGETTDILATVIDTGVGIRITGVEPFGGILIPFTPIPEGFKGRMFIYKEKTLSGIVERAESAIFRMGSTPTCYYEYKDGYCCGYYDIEEIPN